MSCVFLPLHACVPLDNHGMLSSHVKYMLFKQLAVEESEQVLLCAFALALASAFFQKI